MAQYSTIHRRQDPATTRVTPTTLIVAIDMAKYNPKALICDYQGTILEAPFVFGPHQLGVQTVIQRAETWRVQVGATQVIVGIEPTGRYHEPVVRQLAAHGWAVRLLSTTMTAEERQADHRRSKTDPIDLMAIARCVLNARGSEQPLISGIPAALRAVSRSRRIMVHQQTRIKNLIRSVVDQTFLEYQGFQDDDPGVTPTPLLDLWSRSGRIWIRELPLPQDYRQFQRADLSLLNRREKLRLPESTLDRIWTAAGRAFPVPDEVAPVWRAHLERLYELYSAVSTLVARYEQDQEALLVQTEAVVWLTTPGIGVITAADVYGEWRTLTHATSPKKLVKYGGLDPTISGSGKRPDHYGAISYQGSRWFRAALCQAGSMVIEPAHQNAYFLALADRFRERGLTRRQIDVVAAHKLVRIWWAMLAHHQVFAPPTWNGPALAADWRPKVHTVAHRRTAEATWSQFMTTRTH